MFWSGQYFHVLFYSIPVCFIPDNIYIFFVHTISVRFGLDNICMFWPRLYLYFCVEICFTLIIFLLFGPDNIPMFWFGPDNFCMFCFRQYLHVVLLF